MSDAGRRPGASSVRGGARAPSRQTAGQTGLNSGVRLLLKDAWLCRGHGGDYRWLEGCSPRTLQSPGSEGCSVPAAAAGAGERELTPLPKPCVPPLLPPLRLKQWESLGWGGVPSSRTF